MWFIAITIIIVVIVFGIYSQQKAEYQSHTTNNSGYFNTDVVGESFYTKAIRKCFDFYVDKSTEHIEDVAYCQLKLILDDDNEYDKKAVAVISKFGKVGHLSKSNARKYRKQINRNKKVPAKIYCDPDTGNYGIWLDLDLD